MSELESKLVKKLSSDVEVSCRDVIDVSDWSPVVDVSGRVMGREVGDSEGVDAWVVVLGNN